MKREERRKAEGKGKREERGDKTERRERRENTGQRSGNVTLMIYPPTASVKWLAAPRFPVR